MFHYIVFTTNIVDNCSSFPVKMTSFERKEKEESMEVRISCVMVPARQHEITYTLFTVGTEPLYILCSNPMATIIIRLIVRCLLSDLLFLGEISEHQFLQFLQLHNSE